MKTVNISARQQLSCKETHKIIFEFEDSDFVAIFDIICYEDGRRCLLPNSLMIEVFPYLKNSKEWKEVEEEIRKNFETNN